MTPGSPDSVSVADALTRHYVEHALPPDGGEQNAWFRVHIGPLALPLPNLSARKRAVLYHDVNHLLTGYNTVFSDGEMVIAGYELGSGCGRFWIAWLINLGMFGLGLGACPRRLFHAFLRGRRAESVYHWDDRASLRATSVEDLRIALGVRPSTPPARVSDRFMFAAWSVFATTFVLGPVLAAGAAVALLV